MLAALRGWWTRKGNYAYANKERAVWHREGPKVTVRQIGIEWHFLAKAKRLMLTLGVDDGHEGTYYLHVGIPFLFNFYIGIDARPNRFTAWFCGKGKARETGFSIDKDLVHLQLHRCRDDWSVDQFNGWQLIKDWYWLFLGDRRQHVVDVKHYGAFGPLPATVNFPEGKTEFAYTVIEQLIAFHHSRWYMSWYKPRQSYYTIAPTVDVIVHGKRGDEKMYESTIGGVKSAEEAITQYIKRIERDMQR